MSRFKDTGGKAKARPKSDVDVKTFELQVDVEPLEDGWFLASALNLQGCRAEARSREEALDFIVDVAKVIIELSLAKGLALPQELAGISEPPAIKAVLIAKVGE